MGEKSRLLKNWEEVNIRLLRRFRPSQEGSLCAQFLSRRQSTAVREYRQGLETLASSLTEVSEEIMDCNFLNRPRPNIRAEVYLLRPLGLEQIMEVA